ncbi:MAG TPA: hypothetical protein VFE27_14650 [Acidobacteriaceae bacterium]|nr:hypothetical protein [Acidobacteriaceae bacterium]
MERLLQDIRYGARSILKAPRFAVAAVLTLALGIGANTAMFSVIRSVLMRSLPFPNPGRLLLVSQRQANGNSNLFSAHDYLDWKQQGRLLAHTWGRRAREDAFVNTQCFYSGRVNITVRTDASCIFTSSTMNGLGASAPTFTAPPIAL